jgi:hypothetical protein
MLSATSATDTGRPASARTSMTSRARMAVELLFESSIVPSQIGVHYSYNIGAKESKSNIR